jgi:hypothetical protein
MHSEADRATQKSRADGDRQGSEQSRPPADARRDLRGQAFDVQRVALEPAEAPSPRRRTQGGAADVQQAASHGVSGPGGALPHAERIQQAFGAYDVGQVQAHTDQAAADGSAAMGAEAYATGEHVAFGGAPDLHTAAHEAAHVVQQRAGVSLAGGVGQAGDRYEQHADAVADAVVAGASAEPLLGEMGGGAAGGGAAGACGGQRASVQRKETPPEDKPVASDGETPRDQAGPDPLAEKRKALSTRMKEDLEPRVRALEERLERLSGLGVDVAPTRRELKALREGAKWTELTTAAAGGGDAASLDSATAYVDTAVAALTQLDSRLDAAIDGHRTTLAEKRKTLEARITEVMGLAAPGSWALKLFAEDFAKVRTAGQAALGAADQVVAGLSDLALADGPARAAALTETETAFKTAADDTHNLFRDGVNAIDALAEHVRKAVGKAKAAQDAALAVSPGDFAQLFGTPRVGGGPDKPKEARLAALLADAPAPPGRLADHAVALSSYPPVPDELEAGLAIDGREAEHWQSTRIPEAAVDARVEAADATEASNPWVKTVYSAERERLDTAVRERRDVVSKATGEIRKGAAGGGVDLTAQLTATDAAVGEKAQALEEATKAGLGTAVKLDQDLGALAGTIKASKNGALAVVPPDLKTLWETARFGDETTPLEARVKAEIPGDRAYEEADPAKVRALYQALPGAQAKVAEITGLDKVEVAHWNSWAEPLQNDAKTLIEQANLVAWLRKYEPQALEGQADFDMTRFATAMTDTSVRAGEAIAKGRRFQPTIQDLVLTLKNNLPLYEQEKARVKALAGAPVTAQDVVNGLKAHLASLPPQKPGAETAVGDALRTGIREALALPLLKGTLAAAPGVVEIMERRKLEPEKLDEVLYDLIVTRDELKHALIKAFVGDTSDPKAAKGAAAVLDAVAPAKELARRIDGEIGGGAEPMERRLKLVQDYVARWGEAEVNGVLKATRTDPDFIAATTRRPEPGIDLESSKSFDDATLAVVHEMLMTGKVISFKPAGPTNGSKADVFVDGDDDTLPVHKQLELASQMPPEERKKHAFKGIATAMKLLLDDVKAYAAQVTLVDEENAARAKLAKASQTADGETAKTEDTQKEGPAATRLAELKPTSDEFEAVLACRTRPTIVDFVTSVSALEPPFLALIEFALPKPAPVKAAAPAEGEAQAAAETLRLGKKEAKRLDVNGDKGGDLTDTQESERLAKFHTEANNGLKHLEAMSAAETGGLVGQPPDPGKVRYLLDRFEEKHGTPLFKSKPFQRADEERQQAMRAALGLAGTESASYGKSLTELEAHCQALTGRAQTDYVGVAAALRTSMAEAEVLWSQIRDIPAATTLHEAIAPAGRRPTTARMTLIRVFEHTIGKDLLIWLENHLHDTGTPLGQVIGDLFTFLVPRRPEDFKELEAALSEVLGLRIKFEGNGFQGDPRNQGMDLQGGQAAPLSDDKALKDHPLLGDANFIAEGMEVGAGFDSFTALRIAENVHDFLNASGTSKRKLRKKDEDAESLKAAQHIKLGLGHLAGDFGALLAELDAGGGQDALLKAVDELSPDQRDAADSAFRARYGRTMMAEFAAAKVDKKVSDEIMGQDARDPTWELKKRFRKFIEDREKAQVIIEAVSLLTPSERTVIKSDTEIHAGLLGLMGTARKTELENHLDGKSDLAALQGSLKKNDRLLDNIDQIAKDVAAHINTLTKVIQAKYPDALKAPGTGNQTSDAAKAAAELRVDLFRLATGEWGKFAKSQNWFERLSGNVFLNAAELRHLQALILGGGKATAGESILAEWRKTTFWAGKDQRAIKAAVAGLDDTSRAAVQKDTEVRVAIQNTLSSKDAALCFRLLEGESYADVPEKNPKLWVIEFGKSLDGKALLAKVRGLDHDTWQKFRSDEGTVLQLLGRLSGEHAAELRALLKLEDGSSETQAGFETVTGDEQASADAKARFLFASVKAKAIQAARDAAAAHNASGFLTMLQTIFGMKDPELTRPFPAPDKPGVNKHDTARTRLAADPDILQHAEGVFASLWSTYAEPTRLALLGTGDPAPAAVKYHTRGDYGDTTGSQGGIFDSIGSSPEGIAGAITGAGTTTFLTEFTNIATAIGGLIKKWSAMPEGNEKVVLGQTIRRTRLGYSGKLEKSLGKVLADKGLATVRTAFDAKLIATLGGACFEDAKTGAAHRTEVLAVLSSISGVAPDALKTLWDGYDFEAAAKIGTTSEKVEKAQKNRFALFTSGDKKAAGDELSDMREVAQDANAKHDKVDKDANAKLDTSKAKVDEIVAQIDARAKAVKGTLISSATLAAKIVANLLVPGSDLLVTLLEHVGKIALSAAEAWNEGTGLQGFLCAVTGQALTALGGVVTAHVGHMLDSSFDVLKLADVSNWGSLLKEHPLLASAVQGGVDKVLAAVGAGITKGMALDDLTTIRIALERGLGAYVGQSILNIRTSVTEVATSGKAEFVAEVMNASGAKVLETIKKSLTKELLKKVGYVEEAPKDPLLKKLDGGEKPDGKIVEEVKALSALPMSARCLTAVASSWTGLQKAVAKLPLLDCALALHTYHAAPQGKASDEAYEKFLSVVGDRWNDFKKLMVDGGIARGVEALNVLGEFVTNPDQTLADIGGSFEQQYKALVAKSQPHRSFRDFCTSDAVKKLVWNAVVFAGKSSSEAFEQAWSNFRLADDIMQLDTKNAGLLDSLASDDRTERDIASGFIQLKQADGTLKVSLEDYRKRLEEIVGSAVPPADTTQLGRQFHIPLTLQDYVALVASLVGQSINSAVGDAMTLEAKRKVARGTIASELALKLGGGAELFKDTSLNGWIFNELNIFQKTYSGTAATKKTTESLVKTSQEAVVKTEVIHAATALLTKIAQGLWSSMHTRLNDTTGPIKSHGIMAASKVTNATPTP